MVAAKRGSERLGSGPGQAIRARPHLPPCPAGQSIVLAPPPIGRRRRGPVRRLLVWLVLRQPSWLGSFLVHLLLLLILGLLAIPRELPPGRLALTFADASTDEVVLQTLTLEPQDLAEAAVEAMPASADTLDLEPVARLEVALPTFPVLGNPTKPADTDATNTPGGGGGELDGRGGRRGMALQLGATPASEAAVDRALKWLAAHQQSNGQWSFDLSNCGCDGACRHRGLGTRASNGATALALLPFLGAGQTHEQGYHRRNIEAGLRYLIEHQGPNGSFHEPQGTMYSHGMATLVLCESVAMTRTDPGGTPSRYRKQPQLRQAAQRAIDFLVRHQHSAGGWRYTPGEPGDTSVVGWQAMALQSGRMAGLKVPKRNLDRISRFLDSVMADDYGGEYGYLNGVSRPATSAVGVLSRMYLGWDRTHGGVIAGAEYLDRLGPSANNVYFNYYATQVMHHYGGPLWEKWHPLLRDHLVQTQEQDGHETGSWYFDDDFGSIVGGRLYITAMNTMVLEVYYRHMPIYSEAAVARTRGLKRDE